MKRESPKLSVLIQFQKIDGTFAELGTTDQWIMRDLKTLRGVIRRVNRLVANYHPAKVGLPYRILKLDPYWIKDNAEVLTTVFPSQQPTHTQVHNA